MNIPETPNINHDGQNTTVVGKKRVPVNRSLGFWLSVLVIVVVLLLVYFNKKMHTKHAKAATPQSVVLGTAHITNVPVYLNGLGAVTPVYTVTVKTQINGQLLNVYFREGQEVKKGDLLALIDPRPYETQLIKLEGQLKHDTAVLANDQINLQRFQVLWKQNAVAKQILDTQIATVRQDEGTVQADEGLIATTRLNLVYCHIVSPVDGRIGLRLVDPGNYVQVSDTTGIAVIATASPTTVVFTLPEDNIPDVMKLVYAGTTLPAEAYDRSQTTLLDTGTLFAVDSQIDPTTGTVKLKAMFTNAEHNLFPNQFVNIKLLVKTLINAIVVPTAAIQHGAQGSYIYVVNADKKTVRVQAVETSVTVGDETTVTKGINNADSVVTEGADKLTDGAAVLADSPAATSQTAPVQTAKKKSARRTIT